METFHALQEVLLCFFFFFTDKRLATSSATLRAPGQDGCDFSKILLHVGKVSKTRNKRQSS